MVAAGSERSADLDGTGSAGRHLRPETPEAAPWWAQEAHARIVELRDRLIFVEAPPERDAISARLDDAERLVSQRLSLWRFRKRILGWWNGSRVERTWAYLREAELLFVEFASERGLEIALEDARSAAEMLDPTDPVRVRLEQSLRVADGSWRNDGL